MPPKKTMPTLEVCKMDSAQQFVLEQDGSIRPRNDNNLCLDVYNCEKLDGTSIGLYKCHPNGTAECGYKNQQFQQGAFVWHIATLTYSNIFAFMLHCQFCRYSWQYY